MSEPLKGAALRLWQEPRVCECGALMEEMIRDVIAEAKAEEREACARIAEGSKFAPGLNSVGMAISIAAEIRRRGEV